MSLYDIIAALQEMGKEMKALGDEAVKTAEKAREAASTASGMGVGTGGSGGGASISSSSGDALGDPRNAADSAMRMNAAIEAAKRR